MKQVRIKSALAVVSVIACVTGVAVAATPVGSAPPTYDYDATIPGVQPPGSPLLVDYDYRSVRPYQVTFPVLVPQAELQAIMPVGFYATPSSSGAATSTVSMAFFIDQRFDRTGVGTFGPVSGVLVSTTALNKNVSPNQSELVFPAFAASGEIDALNESFGPGAAKQAGVSVTIKQAGGTMRFLFKVEDKATGLDVTAGASSPSGLNNRSISDPVGLVFRTFDGKTANQGFRAASQSDTLSVATTSADAKLQTPHHRLKFPAGSLTVVGLGPNITFARNVEFIIKLPSSAGTPGPGRQMVARFPRT